MVSLLYFIQINGLQQADAIVLRKKILGMVDHYAVFLGFRNGAPVFVANYQNGVKEVTEGEMQNFLQTLEPTQIDRYPGPEHLRLEAVQRALSRVGERAYSYIANNCEHFKNWVHHGENRSKQVNNVGNAVIAGAAVAGVTAIAARNPKVALFAVLLLLLGAGLKHAANED